MSNQHLVLGIWKEIAGLNLSPSHDRWHIDRVMNYAEKLVKIHGGDIEIITAAVLLHDLGRGDPQLRGTQSSNKSVEIAQKILHQCGFPDEKVKSVLTAIGEHDQTEITPSTLEGRILKDADFLAGFGPWGVLRIAMWAGETGDGIDQIFNRLQYRMPKRLESLEFPESKKIAKREMAFSRLFVSLLHKELDVDLSKQRGIYIILEGISGSGKNTQAEWLQRQLSDTGITTILKSEPTDLYKEARNLWKDQKGDPFVQTFLFMADRYKQIKSDIWPALEKGQMVISVRSYLSTIVYQANEVNQQDFIDFFHQFVPIPDMVFILDLPATVAYSRIKNREKYKNRPLGDFETIEALEHLRSGYLQMVQHRPGEGFIVIDAQASTEEVNAEIWRHISKARVLSNL